MPGIPYVLEYVKNIEHKVCQEYLKHDFCTLAYKNTKHNSMPENLGLWVCQAYLMCWNTLGIFLAQGMPGIPLA